mgnify:CR=1 FL=1
MSRQTRHPLLLRTKNMATAYQNLSEYDFNSVPDGSEVTVGIVVAAVSYTHLTLPTNREV